jgi:ABC-2 type transport system ATP-binding protein
MPILETDALTRCYGDQTAIDRLTFSVEKVEVCGLLGPTGTGKTATIRMLTSLLSPTAGRTGGI